MKKIALKAAAATPKMRLLDTRYNTDNMIEAARAADRMGARIIVFPELSITGATAGDLYRSVTLTDSAKEQLERYLKETAPLGIVSFVGLPVRTDAGVLDCIAVTEGGKVLVITPREELPRSLGMRAFAESNFDKTFLELLGACVPISRNFTLTIDGYSVKIAFDPFADIGTGADITVIPTAYPKTVGSYDRLQARALELTSGGGALIIATAGFGESGTDALYDAQNVISAGGRLLAVNTPFVDDVMLVTELDSDMTIAPPEAVTMPARSPFIPDDPAARERVCAEIFEIQSRALAGRIQRAYAKCAVIGVSGGLDSTLAVLVAARAADILGTDRRTVKAVTMPCFGTTARTKSNAERLSVALGTDFKTVDIKRAVSVHFEDIGHSAEDLSVVYENAQARERTQVIMDIANAEGGMVIGTGDLSELVLGWATYNGDHMSMYGVNSGIPKTVIRHVTSYCADRAEQSGDTECAMVLRDVLNTPVSPELLPPKDGEIAQCTEGIVGPYELHDFFLYHLLKSNASPSEIYSLALVAFKDTEYTPEVIKGWLRVFHRRFFAQQFKRSCLPDGPMIYDISVSPRGGLVMPSDASSVLWLAEIDALN